MLCNAEAQRSEVCIVDGTITWQIKSSNSVAAEAIDLSSDEAGLVSHEAVMANDARPTLIDINFTVPKVFNFLLSFMLFYEFRSLFVVLAGTLQYADGAGNTVEENSSIFSLIQMC